VCVGVCVCVCVCVWVCGCVCVCVCIGKWHSGKAHSGKAHWRIRPAGKKFSGGKIGKKKMNIFYDLSTRASLRVPRPRPSSGSRLPCHAHPPTIHGAGGTPTPPEPGHPGRGKRMPTWGCPGAGTCRHTASRDSEDATRASTPTRVISKCRSRDLPGSESISPGCPTGERPAGGTETPSVKPHGPRSQVNAKASSSPVQGRMAASYQTLICSSWFMAEEFV
jgi:hypothetical protein